MMGDLVEYCSKLVFSDSNETSERDYDEEWEGRDWVNDVKIFDIDEMKSEKKILRAIHQTQQSSKIHEDTEDRENDKEEEDSSNSSFYTFLYNSRVERSKNLEEVNEGSKSGIGERFPLTPDLQSSGFFDSFINSNPTLLPSIEEIYFFVMSVREFVSYSPQCNIVALVYLNRVLVSRKILILKSNWRGLLLMALILAQKVCDDVRFSLFLLFSRLYKLYV